jgi:hypothetical protein
MPLPTLGRRALLGAAAAFGADRIPAARAASLGMPTGKPILTISGAISVTNDGNAAKFDVAMLEALGTDSFSTSTPWYDRPMTFAGVPLVRVMQAVGATGTIARAVALDDYASDLPIAEFAQYGTLLALKLDGKYMAVSDKGPCFIIYPFDKYPELRNAKYFSRSIWQVAGVVVR